LKDPLDNLPSDWTVVCLALKEQLLECQVHEGGQPAVAFQQPVDLKGLLAEFEELMVANTRSTSLACTSACKTSSQKREWRKSREKLDKQLGRFLSELETTLGLEVLLFLICVSFCLVFFGGDSYYFSR